MEVFSALEKAGGLALGITYGVFLLSLILISMIFTPLSYFEKSVKERSFTGRQIAAIAPFVYDKVAAAVPALKADARNEALLGLTAEGAGAARSAEKEKK